MTSRDSGIFVRSHTARDLLQSAALFKTDKLVVWEYVSNGLQYVDSGVAPVVKVLLDPKRKRITISDNGRGMDWAGLHNFFIMHGENLDRREGRPGRGRFGTGKSAALGIAGVLRLRTVRQGKRSSVELLRRAVDEMKAEDPVPVTVLEKGLPTTEENGTTVEIADIHLRSLDQAGIIKYVERHLARWPRNATVFVNNHECEFADPPVAETRRYRTEGAWRDKLGDAELVLKVSKAPLEEEQRGVSVFANGVWYESTLAGSEGREMSQYIFGEIDVPRLDDDMSPIPPFDMTRSMRLNSSNELVQHIYAFVGQRVEEIRGELVESERQRKATEEARKLEKQASEIARVINEDFDSFRQKLARAKAKGSGGSDLRETGAAGSGSDEDVLFGSDLPANPVSPVGAPGSIGGDGESGDSDPRNLMPEVTSGPPEAEKRGQPAGRSERNQRLRGGFQVEFDHMGEASHRAQYMRERRTIYVNLDHPQLEAARALEETEDVAFRRLAYEVAFSEYAIALASELAARDEYMDPLDPIFDIRETLNRVARRAANLYRR